MRSSSRVAMLIVAVCALVASLAASADAAMIEIQVAGLDLVYDGTDIYDAEDILGGIGDPAESDPLISMSFLVDNVLVGTLTSDIFADVLIEDVTGIPDSGGFVITAGQGDSFGFDLLTSNSTPGWGLSLNLDQVQVFYSGGQIFIAGGGVAESLGFQDLPFNIEMDDTQEITIAFSSSALSNVSTGGGFLAGFKSSGTGNVRGIGTIPEPATVALALAACSLCASLRRRR